MTFPYVRRKQPPLAGMGDGKWHRIIKQPMISAISEAGTKAWAKYLKEIPVWRLGREKTLCGQAYIAKFWTPPAADHDHFREVCEDCRAELAAMVLTERVRIDGGPQGGV